MDVKFSIIAFLFLLAVQVFAENEWNAYSDPFPVHDVVPYGDDGILLATDGGIRYRTQTGDFVFHSEHGLETSAFYSIVSSKDYGTFAVSEFGLIAAINDDGETWHVANRSYLKNNVRAVPGEAEVGGFFLVIAFEDRLAFFDLKKSTSLLTLDRIGSNPLQMNPVKKLAVHGDSLYVKTEKDVFVRVMDWEHLSEDMRLGDPSSWVKISTEKPIAEFEPWDSTRVVVGGRELKGDYLFDNSVSRTKWYIRGKDGYYMVGPYCVWFLPDGADMVKNFKYETYTLGEVYELKATPVGGVLAASVDGKMSYGNKVGWREPEYVYNGFGNELASYAARMKVLNFLPDGSVFYHIWGIIYQIYSHWGNEHEYSFMPTDGYCFDNFLENYPISSYVIPAPDSSGFLTATASSNGYSIVYFTKNGDVRCAKNVGSMSSPKKTVAGPMYATIDEDGSWIIYVASKRGTPLSDEGDLDMFKFPAPNRNGGELDNGVMKTFRGISPAPIDIAYDTSANRLWVISMSNLAYLDDEQDTLLVPSSTNGLVGAEYTSLEVDVHGNLWLGTANQGVYRLSQKGRSPDTLSVLRFTSRDGLLSDNVADVAIDAVTGTAWFAHGKGVSYYHRNDLKYADKNMTDSATVRFRAYPIPFRPREHSFFTIEGITEDAVVSIYNRGGALIRSFRNDEVAGGILEWDGRGKDHLLVAPGVYYYAVRHSGKVKKGKFIIVH